MRLVDIADCRPLFDLLFRVGRFVPVGNFVAEIGVKTLSGDLSAPQRRTQRCTSMMVAGKTRLRIRKMFTADFTWAAAHIEVERASASARVPTPPQLLGVDLGVAGLPSVPKARPGEGKGCSEGEEGVDSDSDSVDEGKSTTVETGAGSWKFNPKVKVNSAN